MDVARFSLVVCHQTFFWNEIDIGMDQSEIPYLEGMNIHQFQLFQCSARIYNHIFTRKKHLGKEYEVVVLKQSKDEVHVKQKKWRHVGNFSPMKQGKLTINSRRLDWFYPRIQLNDLRENDPPQGQ